MELQGRYTIPAKPFDPSDYIISHEIDVVCLTAEKEPVVAGRIGVDFFDMGLADEAGQDVLHICDANSSGWTYICESLIESTDGFSHVREDFNLDSAVNSWAFMHCCVFHPELKDWRKMIIGQICNMFPNFSAVVMFKKSSPLADEDLSTLGFRIAAGTELILRPNMYRCEYSVANDPLDPFDLVVSSDTTKYVNECWKQRD